MENKLLFGTAGPPSSSKKKSSVEGIQRVRELGLDCMELEFVQGVRMGEKKAGLVRSTASELDVRLSCHAPYFINFASPEPDKVEASIQRIFDAARIGSLCGARSIVFHAGFYMKRDPEVIYNEIRNNLERTLKKIREAGIEGIILRPELTGKATQFGDMGEILRLSSDLDGVIPCIDFSHLFARTVGECNSKSCFKYALGKMHDALGEAALKDVHVHLSGIEYGPKGERKHLPVEDSEIKYLEVLDALAEYGAAGLVICESPADSKERNALEYQDYYQRHKRIKE